METVSETSTSEGPIEKQIVVIALDGSDMADHAVNWYVRHVHRKGNKVVFVHCIELPEMKLTEAQFSKLHLKDQPGVRKNSNISPGVLAGMWKEEEAKVRTLEGKMKALLKDKGISGVLRTATGKPGEVIVRVAEEEKAAMIVVGTRGMSKMRRTILGSVSDFLVHHASCPVIVCRTKVRRPSGTDGKRSRHVSGESIRALFQLGKARSHSVSSDNEI